MDLLLLFVVVLLLAPCTLAKRELQAARLSKQEAQTAPLDEASEGNHTETGVLPPFLQSNSSLPNDLSITGNCSREIGAKCKRIVPGESNLVDCITAAIRADRAAVEDTGQRVSEACQEELRQFKVARSQNVILDKKLVKACRKDIASLCKDPVLMPVPEDILKCLRENRDQVKKRCKKEVFRLQMDAADDFKLDPLLYEACSKDAVKFCRDVEPGEGQIQACLRDQRQKLQWECQTELFRQEIENSDDIRLDFQLILLCQEDKNKFCADVAPGDARVKDCLEDHRVDPDFSPSCKAQFDKMMAERASDFRLDGKLRKYCLQDIKTLCYADYKELRKVPSWDAKVTQCLQDYRNELKDPRCKAQVHKLTERAAEDIRFDKPLAEACREDRKSICSTVPDGGGQVFQCLQHNRNKLSESCRQAVFDEEVRFAEDIDFKFPMKQACIAEIERFCKGIPDGHAEIIACLQDHVDNVDMGENCRKEVEHDQVRSAEDYRLNYRLNKACSLDMNALCMEACDKQGADGVACAGAVLRCLQDNLDKLRMEGCKKEVAKFQQAEARDIRVNVPFERACTGDLARWCKDKAPDHGEQLACLRSHREELSEKCGLEELRFSMMEAADLRLIPSLMNACATELERFCRAMNPLEGAAFKCLQQNLGEVEFGAPCKAEVNLQEARHAEDYRLDIRLRKECEPDVQSMCKDLVMEGRQGHALVLRCLVEQYPVLRDECQTEVSYATRMALWQYKEGADLTAPCDPPVNQHCKGPEARGIGGTVIAIYGQCLADVYSQGKDLPPKCLELVRLATQSASMLGGGPMKAQPVQVTNQQVDVEKLGEELANHIAKKEEERREKEPRVEVQAATTNWVPEGLVLTGWVAFAAVSALVVVLIGIGYALYRRYRPTRPYTLVTKAGDI